MQNFMPKTISEKMEDILTQLPSIKDLKKTLDIKFAESIGVNPCGDTQDGFPVYKLLTKEGIMITYHRYGGLLFYVISQQLH